MRLRIGRLRGVWVAAGGVVVVATGAAALSVVAPPAVAAAPAVPQIYVSEFGDANIDAGDLDGTGFSSGDFITGTLSPEGVAVDGQHIYWAHLLSPAIGRANLDGTGVDEDYITGVDDPFGVAVDGQHIYWANDGNGTIGEANLDGTGVNQSFITGADDPHGVAVDGQHIYWANNGNGTIGEANLDGTGVNQSFITGADQPWGVAVDGQHVYWVNNGDGTIGEANLDGTDATQSLITANQPTELAVDGQHIYWVNDFGDTIGEATLDGSDVDQTFITGTDFPAGIAVSVPVAHVTPAAPSAFAATVPGALSAPQTLTISNAGQQALSVGDVSFAGQNPGDFVIGSNGCMAAVPPGASCKLTVRFSPTAVGSRSATLRIATSDFANSPLRVPLSGTGQAPPPPPPPPPTTTTTTTPVTTPPPPLTTAPGGGRGGQGGATASVPALNRLRVSPKTVHVGGRKTKGGKCVAQTRHNRHSPVCTRKAKLTVGFRLTAPASVKLKLTGRVPGRRAGKRCVAQTRHNARAKECTRLVTMKGMAARQGKVGANRFTLSRKLAPGVYTLTAAPVGGAAKKATYKVTN